MRLTSSLPITIIAVLAAFAVLSSCRGRALDARLLTVADSVATNPQAADEILFEINPATLSGDNRHFYDLLLIKSRYKNQVRHTSDSTITSVVNWARGYGDEQILTEALYYGARVYSDLGDYPLALRYVQEALDRLPTRSPDPKLRGKALSLAASVLSNLHLYDQAIPYITERIELDNQEADTQALVFGYEQLGSLCIGKKDYAQAIMHYEKARELSAALGEADDTFFKAKIAEAYNLAGDNLNALEMLYDIPAQLAAGNDCNSMGDSYRDYFYKVASRIYYDAALYDSTYKYAGLLIQTPSRISRINGYEMLLKPELIGRFDPDTLLRIISRYSDAITADYDSRSNYASIIQNSRFNYAHYEHENELLGQERHSMLIWIYAMAAVIIILICIVIIYRMHEDKKRNMLRKTLLDFRELNAGLAEENTIFSAPSSIHALENEIDSEIYRLKNEAENRPDESKTMWEDTKAYKIVTDLLKEGKAISDKDPKWESIISSVKQHSPEFFPAIRRFSSSSLSVPDYHLATLIHIGFSSSDIAIILSKSKSAITYSRKTLIKKLFGDSVKLRELDSLLRSL